MKRNLPNTRIKGNYAQLRSFDSLINKFKILIPLILFITLSFVNFQAKAQSDTIKKLSIYNDSKGPMYSRNGLKLNLMAAIGGDLAISYERVLSDRISLEFGFRKQVNYLKDDIIESVIEDYEGTINPSSGYGYSLQGRWNFMEETPEGFYVSFMFRNRFFKEDDFQFIYSDYLYGFGYEYVFSNDILLDLTLFNGFSGRREKDNKKELDSPVLVVPFQVKIGYVFDKNN